MMETLDDFDESAFTKLLAGFPYGVQLSVKHDGFAGSVIGYYVTREGKPGLVLQLDDARVVHVYSTKWFSNCDQSFAATRP